MMSLPLSIINRGATYWWGSRLLWKSTNAILRSPASQKLSTQTPATIVDLPAGPTHLAKFRCHPTIPCDIPRTYEDLSALWYHIPDDLLPTNWSSDWSGIFSFWFLPSINYSMGDVDLLLKAKYRIPYPIKGVMFCTVERIEPGGLFEEELPHHNIECIVFQDAVGDYYFYYEFSQGGDEYVAKFRAPRGTSVSDFVKDHFQGGVKGVDMDLVIPENSGCEDSRGVMFRHERKLGMLREQAQAESRCACRDASREAKLKTLKPVT